MDACFCDDVEESQQTREREKKRQNKKEKKKQMETLGGPVRHRREHTGERVHPSVFREVTHAFLHFFPALFALKMFCLGKTGVSQ